MFREESAYESVGGGRGGLVCSLGCWSIITGIYALSIPAPHFAVRCYATNARGAPVLQVELDTVAPWLGGLCAPWYVDAARTGRAVVLLGGGCLSVWSGALSAIILPSAHPPALNLCPD